MIAHLRSLGKNIVLSSFWGCREECFFEVDVVPLLACNC